MVMTRYQVDPSGRFKIALNRASKKSSDLTLPFNLIAQSWYKTNRAIFALKGPGKYKDLSPLYKNQKRRRLGFVYPILEGKNKRIKNAITNPTDTNAINRIKNRKTLELGVRKTPSFPYPAVHMFGYKNTPKRPYLFAAGESAAPDQINRRVDIWIKIIKKHIVKTAKREL